MHNPYRGGTADVWYSHTGGDLWAEYKWIAKIPRKGRVVPDLSPLQEKWLRGRFEEHRKIVVIVGHPKGAVVLHQPEVWERGLTAAQFTKQTVTRQQLAEWISS